jgi:hypothetical protein
MCLVQFLLFAHLQFIRNIQERKNIEAAVKAQKHGSVRAEGFQRAIGKPFGRVRRRETLHKHADTA